MKRCGMLTVALDRQVLSDFGPSKTNGINMSSLHKNLTLSLSFLFFFSSYTIPLILCCVSVVHKSANIFHNIFCLVDARHVRNLSSFNPFENRISSDVKLTECLYVDFDGNSLNSYNRQCIFMFCTLPHI